MQEPSPADIRPLHILKETLQLLKRKWKDNHNYAYALDQFKSMRQDLTVSISLSIPFSPLLLVPLAVEEGADVRFNA